MNELTLTFSWLLGQSIAASIIICLLLLIRKVLWHKFPARWTSLLWILLTLRMICPWLPESKLSLFNLFPHLENYSFFELLESENSSYPLFSGNLRAPDTFDDTSTEEQKGDLHNHPESKHYSILEIATTIWLLGVAILSFHLLLATLTLWLLVKAERPLTKQKILDLLEDCKKEMGIQTIIGLIPTDKIESPALFGYLRPRLLFPKHHITTLNEKELRHVFLHELAHLKRMDIYFGWLVSLLQIIHWFNPLVWYAFRQFRLDREIACDELALSVMKPIEPIEYGKTLINLLAEHATTRKLPALASVLEDGAYIKRRVTMISRFKKKDYKIKIYSLVILIALACTTMTVSARTGQATREKVELAVTSEIDAKGHIRDKVDWPFVNDPALIGGWRTVDFVREPIQFSPGKKFWGGKLYMKELHIFPKGRTSLAFNWTKGLIINHASKTAAKYEIKKMKGKQYLFMEWKSGDYVFRHQKPSYYVLVKDDSLVHIKSQVKDNIDFPFVNDLKLLGNWTAVDFVTRVQDFAPEKKHFQGDLYIKKFEAKVGGKVIGPWSSWTKGVFINTQMSTASRYKIKYIKNTAYLFVEWKSGDYVYRRAKPKYYVFKKS